MSIPTRFSLVPGILLFCLTAVSSASVPGTGHVCTYRISSKGFGVGRLKTVIARQDGKGSLGSYSLKLVSLSEIP